MSAYDVGFLAGQIVVVLALLTALVLVVLWLVRRTRR